MVPCRGFLQRACPKELRKDLYKVSRREITAQDWCRGLTESTCALTQRIHAQDLCKEFIQRICAKNLCRGFLEKTCAKHLPGNQCKRSTQRLMQWIYAGDLWGGFLHRTYAMDLCTGPVPRISSIGRSQRIAAGCYGKRFLQGIGLRRRVEPSDCCKGVHPVTVAKDYFPGLPHTIGLLRGVLAGACGNDC